MTWTLTDLLAEHMRFVTDTQDCWCGWQAPAAERKREQWAEHVAGVVASPTTTEGLHDCATCTECLHDGHNG